MSEHEYDGPSFQDRFRNIGNFRKRPETPDFWRLAEQVSERDRQMDITKGEAFEAEIAHYVDPDTIAYLAIQRALRVLGIDNTLQMSIRHKEVAQLAAIYIDGFVSGAAFQAAGGHQATGK